MERIESLKAVDIPWNVIVKKKEFQKVLREN